MNLSTRFSLAMIALVLLTAATVGFITYHHLEHVVIPMELDRLSAKVTEVSLDLDSYVHTANAEILSIRKTSSLKKLIRAYEVPENTPAQQAACMELGNDLASHLEACPVILQYRLIGLEGEGFELVRADRSGTNNSIRLVPPAELQPKGQRDYVRLAGGLSDGETYTSPIELNREHGELQTPHVPVLRVGTPVFRPDGTPFGVMVINLDMRPIFTNMLATLSPQAALYVVNEDGDFVLHQDHAREFGRDFGHPTLAQDEFPELAPLLHGKSPAALLLTRTRKSILGAAIKPLRLAPNVKIITMATLPYGRMMAAVEHVRQSSVVAAAIACLAAVLIAVWMSRAISRPLSQMTEAVIAFANGEDKQVPTRASGEVGVLARNFDSMRDEVREKNRLLVQESLERERAENTALKLDERARLLSAAVNSSNDAIITEDLQGFITSWNPAAEKLYGFTAAEAIGQSTDMIISPDIRTEMHAIKDKVRRGVENEHRLNTFRLNKQGERLDISLTISPVVSFEGTIVGISKIARNITQEKKLEARLQQNQKLESIGTLAGGIAHDFNNILATILGNISLAELDVPPDSPAIAYLDEINSASKRASHLIAQILTFSRKTEVNRQPLQLSALIKEVEKFLRATLPAMIEIRSETGAGLHPIQADATQVHQVLMNLGTNAGHAMKGRGGKLVFTAANIALDDTCSSLSPVLRPGKYVQLSVSDTGTGMDSQTLEKIFDPFFTTKPVGEGTGLGLSVVHGIMQEHGGAITVYSELGKGTVFHLYFPALEKPEKQDPIRKAHAAIEGNNEHIMYVDDEEPLVHLATTILKRLGYRISAFSSSAQALEAFKDHPYGFDLVVTDFSMPEMDGPGLVREIQKIRPDQPVMMVTGYLRPEDTAKASGLNLLRLAVKPNTVQDMGRVIHEVIAEINARKK